MKARKSGISAAAKHGMPGLAMALAITPEGAKALRLECMLLSGRGRLILTGQLAGEARESAQVALTLARSLARRFGIPPQDFHRTDVHFHVPGGDAVKNGPSAGLALLMALVSAMIRIPLDPETAFIGEISLSGKIYPVDWMAEKSLAAAEAGITRLYLPAENAQEAAGDIRIIPVGSVEDALRPVFGKAQAGRKIRP